MPGKIPAHIRKNDMNFSEFRKVNKGIWRKSVKIDTVRTESTGCCKITTKNEH